MGIAFSTVSKALNGKEGISEVTREKVIRVAAEMGYRPNMLARSLVAKQSRIIGVIVPDIQNPYYAEIISGIINTANEEGYSVMICDSGYVEETELAYFEQLRGMRVDGMIVKPVRDEKDYENLSVPVMMIERGMDTDKHTTVEVDNKKGGDIAISHLIECGCKNIGIIIGNEDSYSVNRRLQGAILAMENHEVIWSDKNFARTKFTLPGGYNGAKMLFEERRFEPDGLFCLNDIMALGAIQYCAEHGHKVPADVSIVGFDNVAYAELPQIMLTTIHQPKYRLGEMIAKALFSEMKAKGKGRAPKKTVLEPKLIIRNTTSYSKEEKTK
jgi:LacI family transcriptional regulator